MLDETDAPGRPAEPAAQARPKPARKRPSIAKTIIAKVDLPWLAAYAGKEFVYVLKFPIMKGQNKPTPSWDQWCKTLGYAMETLHSAIRAQELFLGNDRVRFVKGSYHLRLHVNREHATALNELLVKTERFAIPEDLAIPGLQPFFHVAKESPPPIS